MVYMSGVIQICISFFIEEGTEDSPAAGDEVAAPSAGDEVAAPSADNQGSYFLYMV